MQTPLLVHADLASTELTLDPKPTAYFGRGRVAEVGGIVTALGATHALIVTDPFLATTDVAAAVRASLEGAGLAVSMFDGVTPNPTTTCVDAGSDLAAASGIDVLVAVGGGSSMDAAKGISLGAVNSARGAGLDYTNSFEKPALPIVAVPTTAGTGAEVNAFGVVTDVEAHRKFYVGHDSALPKAAILDPELTLGLPPKATAATGMDALTHAIESYSSIRPNPFSDGIALQVVAMVAEFLPRAVADGSDIEARSQLLLASHIAGVGFSHTGLGLVHAIGHPLGGRFNIPHGLALCLVIEDVLRFNLRTRLDRTARLAFALGVGNTAASTEENAESAIAAVASLAAQVGMTGRLSDFGVSATDLDTLVADTLADSVINNTPVPPTADEVLTILKKAL
ncbi:alcohol dehydrogenase [Arthrobacter silviterrae]|uniref:Iron-containing alcohol dehydrogenase n=1 Tax=Arthrobacter silviterrae TaxID=2026658 RepID=A0ABX0DCM6_9MICC|nr:iron-containing alcohol dehydrogenase [Arthrobacter silviterrae]MDQ0276491.1 alcohol dehydrogenase [Arthrobacter silviterrae]NGN84671.1 iron-containing alcohol dehydrogenase [Arthrobacter silviterrae]